MKHLLLFVKLSGILAFFGLGSCAPRVPLPPAHPEPARELRERISSTRKLSVLFVGNSYSFDVPKAFKRAAAAHKRSVRVGQSTHGGWTLAQHAKHEPTLSAVRSRQWDIVVFQEHSLIPAKPRKSMEKRMIPPLKQLVIEARNAGAVPVLYQTWGRRDGNPDLPGDGFDAMTRRVREGYQTASAELGGVIVVPVGDAWQREVGKGRASELFHEDGSHPVRAGNRLTGETFADFFFREPKPEPSVGVASGPVFP